MGSVINFAQYRLKFGDRCSTCVVGHLWIKSGTLPKESPRDKPEAVGDWELVLNDVGLRGAGMGVVPLVGGKAGHHEQCETDK